MRTQPKMDSATNKIVNLALEMCRVQNRLQSECYEVEISFRTIMFHLLLDKYRQSETVAVQQTTERIYKYHNEKDVQLRLINGKVHELKSRITTIDIEPMRLKLSSETLLKKEDMQGRKLEDGHYTQTRNKVRYIVKRTGYEIHFTIVNNRDRYIEFEMCKQLHRVVKNSDTMRKELLQCLEGYDLVIPQLKIKVVKPIELSKPMFRLHEFLMGQIYVTNKLDGERMFLCSTNGYLVSVNGHGEHIILCTYNSKEFILDTEYYNGTYHAFDMITNDNVDILERTKLLQELVLPSFVKLKLGTVVNNQKELYDCMMKFHTDENDGIIIYKLGTNYYSSNSVFKYKYVPTVDVLTDMNEVYVTNGGSLYRVDVNIVTKKNTKIILPESLVVECMYKNGGLVYVRNRPDKTKPNSLKLYQNFMTCAWMTLDMFSDTTDQLFLMRLHHNRIKTAVLSQCRGALLDIGSGRGGDVLKWQHQSSITSVDCVEPNKKYYRELQTRISKSRYRHAHCTNVGFLEFETDKTYDCATLFFMLNCVPSHEIKQFMTKLYGLLRPSSNAYITFMDGTHLRENTFISELTKDSYIVDYPDTMVRNHKEYRYTCGSIIKIAQNCGFKITRQGVSSLHNEWLSGNNRVMSKLYWKLVLKK